MRIKIHLDQESSLLNVSRVLVSEFVGDNPNLLSNNEIEDRIGFLARQLFLYQSSATVQTDKNYFDIQFMDSAFPEEMREWAAVKMIFEMNASTIHKVASQLEGVKVNVQSAYTFANREWSDVDLVQLAKQGQRGAWFFVNVLRGSVVVKSQENLENQVMGTVFLNCMNMNAPDARMVSHLSSEGKQLSGLGEKCGLNERNPTHYLIMNRVKGPTYSNLSSSNAHLLLVVNNLEKLGELAVYDLVLGNYDRFQMDSMSFNAGNIMFENGDLSPIDTDCVYERERFQFSKFVLKKMIQGKGNYEDKIARKLSENLGKGVQQEMMPSDKIKAGMDKAIAKLVEHAQNMEQLKSHFVEKCRERGVESTVFPAFLEELLHYIKDCKTG